MLKKDFIYTIIIQVVRYMIDFAKRNVDMYKVYRMVGYDYLFYTVISFLFYSIAKGLSVAQILYLSGFYAIFVSAFQIPTNYLVEKIGLKKSIVIGNLFWVIHCFIYIVSNEFIFFVLAEAFCAFGTTLKNLSETQMLYTSLSKINQKEKFSKIEGSGVALFYICEAASAIVVGYLFNFDNYLPIYITFTILVISFVMSLFFVDVQDRRTKVTEINMKDYIKGIKLVLKSNRAISMFLYGFIINGIINIFSTVQKSLLVELNVDTINYSYILAILTLCVGIGSKTQFIFEKVTGRKTLTVIGYIFTASMVLLGVFNLLFIDSGNILNVTITLLVICNLLIGTYRISIKKYMNNFTTSETRGKILSIFYIFENIGRASMVFVAGIILDNAGTRITTIIVGVSVTLILYIVLKFMKSRLGLNPEEYKRKDVFGLDINEELEDA